LSSEAGRNLSQRHSPIGAETSDSDDETRVDEKSADETRVDEKSADADEWDKWDDADDVTEEVTSDVVGVTEEVTSDVAGVTEEVASDVASVVKEVPPKDVDQRAKQSPLKQVGPGVDVMITIIGDFRQCSVFFQNYPICTNQQ
jgi:hypothetical protein